ncbi:cell wall hydrolase [Altererythrobacter confluentis]|uniref:Cell wall hydrolase n=1 Tax=Allopontixanthobacter confluentis TaxID=1849021 RepID=A0A6L7GHJ6_9SPHN|nr:cell wall hydrolase [Allopontixanthobacter confluentis]MXP14754.1 cell wall hydrolase [Allopontixanthobacter confluentis]
MMDTPPHPTAPSAEASAVAVPSRRMRIFLVAFFVVLAGLLFGTLWMANQAKGAAPMHISQKQADNLAGITAGTGAELVLQGESAQERNALIPLVGGTVEKVAGFSALGGDKASFRTALKCMTQAIYYEAANEPVQGKRAVAQVVLNRMRHPAYPSSVCGVVYDGATKPVCQFSFTCDGSLLRPAMARQWEESSKVAEAALTGTIEPSVGTATHYHADYVLPRWAYRLGKIEQIGRHIFYRFQGDWGKARAFTRLWSGHEAIPSLDMARLRNALDADIETELLAQVEDEYVPGLTVTQHVTDRHAAADVGGRIDTTKEWRLSIPDPVAGASSYRATLDRQGEPQTVAAPLLADGAKPAKVNP